jgi:hypothetical protein
MHPLQTWLNPLWIYKISDTDTPISLIKKTCDILQHPHVVSVKPQRLETISKVYVYARRFLQCYRICYGTDVMILWSWQRHLLNLSIHYIYICAVYVYWCMYIYMYAPALEAAAPTVFVVWFWAWVVDDCKLPEVLSMIRNSSLK